MMDFATLSPDDWRPEEIVDSYDSLVWTERYNTFGEFTMIHSEIEETRARLPLDSYVTLMESPEVMIVDSHLIEKNIDGKATLKVQGRSFETILEDRVLTNQIGAAPQKHIAQGDEFSIALDIAGQAIKYGVPRAEDVLPDVGVFGIPLKGTVEDVELVSKHGETYAILMEVVKAARLGVRSYRAKMQIATEDIFVTNQLAIVIYDGHDRSANNTQGNEPVILDYASGHFETMSYLFSNKDHKNLAYVISPLDTRAVAPHGEPTSVSGFDRRILYVDANDISEAPPAGMSIAEVLKQRGRQELSKHTKQRIFDAKISENIPYKYQVDYDLGDLVTIRGEYGMETNLYVTEYTRSHDSSGDSAYPTVAAIANDE